MLAFAAGFSILLVDMEPTTNKVQPVRDLPPAPMDGNESRPMKPQSNSKEIPNSSDSEQVGACPAPIVPLGTVLPCGTVAGVQFMQGERYYFTTGEGVGYLPADIVEKQYSEQSD